VYALRVLKHEAFIRTEAQLIPLMHYQPRLASDREVCV
jgi:hypothetical protein